MAAKAKSRRSGGGESETAAAANENKGGGGGNIRRSGSVTAKRAGGISGEAKIVKARSSVIEADICRSAGGGAAAASPASNGGESSGVGGDLQAARAAGIAKRQRRCWRGAAEGAALWRKGIGASIGGMAASGRARRIAA